MLVTELTVIPSNLHWYLKTFKLKVTRIFHFNQAVRLWSFIILRLPIPVYVLYKLMTEFDRFQEQVAIARYAVWISLSLLSLMNVYWTYQMILLYRNRTTFKQEIAKQKAKLASPNPGTKNSPNQSNQPNTSSKVKKN
jgi:hypothetical protein